MLTSFSPLELRNLFMKCISILFAYLLLLVSTADAMTLVPGGGVFFSEEVIAYDPMGNPFPSVKIDPVQLEGIERYQFALDNGNTLAIKTNRMDPESHGLSSVVEMVRRCCKYIENMTGHTLNENILFYLIEMDSVPLYYKFQASYPDYDIQWGEVRLALIEKNKPLHGPEASDSLNELLFDTLPHELGHDLLDKIPSLLHDIDGRPSYHTRWFIEGVCELLAKGFARQEAPHLWKRNLLKRNIDSVMGNSQIWNQLFEWSQENTNSLKLESDLYGVSFLLLTKWTETVPLKNLLARIEHQTSSVDGMKLLTMLVSSTGLNKNQLFEQTSLHGTNLFRIADLSSEKAQPSSQTHSLSILHAVTTYRP